MIDHRGVNTFVLLSYKSYHSFIEHLAYYPNVLMKRSQEYYMLKGKKSVVEIMDTGWRERDENS